MPLTSLRLSKSRFTAGQQCHRQLWWRVHEPGALELKPDASLQAMFDMGNRVGERARQEFPGAVLIDFDRTRLADAVAATKQALETDASVILEASFFEDDVFVAIDALSREGDAWVVTEVKGASKVKPQYLLDAAVQVHVVEKAGLTVARVELMHLNNQHRHPDEGPLFTRSDITERVAEIRAEVPAEIRSQLRMLTGSLPEIEPGAHCTTPRTCPFLHRCCAPLPDHAIEDLNGIRAKKKGELRDQGIETVDQIPSDFPLNPLRARHRTAVRRNEMVVEPGLGKALANYAFPIALLDFETIGPALPVWEGCNPFGKLPVQFSVHMLEKGEEVSHRAYLAHAGRDPRPRVAEELADALRGAETILAWHASTEKACLESLAVSCPQHATALLEARDKVEDLLPVVKNHLYHPEFRGSFSIKNVVPALLPEMAYEGLDVGDGQTASWILETLLCRPEELSPEEREVLREQLIAYCEHDTAVMVALFRFLSGLPKGEHVMLSEERVS